MFVIVVEFARMFRNSFGERDTLFVTVKRTSGRDLARVISIVRFDFTESRSRLVRVFENLEEIFRGSLESYRTGKLVGEIYTSIAMVGACLVLSRVRLLCLLRVSCTTIYGITILGTDRISQSCTD